MLRHAIVSDKIIRGIIPTLSPNEYHFECLEKGIRDQLILVTAMNIQEPLASKFLYWLGQIEPHKLDGYESITFTLSEYNTCIQLQIPLNNNKHLDLRIDHINRPPPSKLMKSWFSWMFN